MADAKTGKAQKKPGAQKRMAPVGSLVLGKRNVLVLLLGIVVIIIGYLLLGKGSITAAPLLLVLGYCVIVPVSITLWLKKPRDKNQSRMGE